MLISGAPSINQIQPEQPVNNISKSHNPSFTEPTLEENSDLGLGNRIFNTFNQLAAYSRFITGVAVGALALTPLSFGVTFLAEKFELIPQNDYGFEEAKKKFVDTVVQMWANLGVGLDRDAMINTDCYQYEYARQVAAAFDSRGLAVAPSFIYFSVKSAPFIQAAILAPIWEELVFRGLLQDVFLKRIPSFFFRKIAPGKETILDAKIAKAARVLLTAAAFSYAHIMNEPFATRDSTLIKMFYTFVLGIGLGGLKESKAGMPGAIGAHSINNFLALIPHLLMTC